MATQQSGLVSGNKQNTPGGSTGRSRSKFPLSYTKFQTERFAEYFPFFVEEGVSGDILPFHSNHEVQTYTLKSPILQSLTKKKDYFAVPMQAILPLNWEKFYTNPNIGQDVPADCGCGVANFWDKIGTLFSNSDTYLSNQLSSTTTSAPKKLEYMLRYLLFFEMFYSTGSLMETLGISGHNYIDIERNSQGSPIQKRTWDEFFDEVISTIATALSGNISAYIGANIGGDTYTITAFPNSAFSQYTEISLREALELMRDDLSFEILSVSNMSTLVASIGSIYTDHYFTPYTSTGVTLNLSRLWAYQICVSHFYSNDHVDYIYSADLFRQYIAELAFGQSSSGLTESVLRFSVNGMYYQYDALSAAVFSQVISYFGTNGIYSRTNNTAVYPSLEEMWAYFVALFSFKRSLRFLDYFTGSRAYPLAVGNSSVSVNNNAVDIVELSKSSMMTKFLQAVNRSGRKFSAYMKELFGKTPAYDYHNPMFLAHTSDLVGAQETENTGAGQLDASRPLAITSRLRASSARYAFEFQPDRDCILIGISYYDLPRVYLNATERQNFNLDRFDMFNPYLQFTGDQPIYEAEIGTDTPSYTPFSYCNKDMQYKQRYNQACGGFCVPSTGLDNWIFPADTMRRTSFHHISPSFIRSFNSELDRFYQYLTGFSLGTYFHFIVRYDNRQDASRPMAYNPVISI